MKDKNRSYWVIGIILAAIIGLGVLSALGIGQSHVMGYANIRQGLDLQGGVSILFEADVDEPTAEQMSSVESLLRRRLDAKGYTEADAGLQGTKQIRVDIPGVDDAEQAREDIGRTAQLTFSDPSGNVVLTGSEITRAQTGVITEGGTSQIVVNLEMNSAGAAAFAEATRNNIGRAISIMMDDEIISAPTVNSAITDGRCYISGGFTAESAEYLASLIREGSLPFKLNVISMNNVGARLGADALRTSITAGVIGIALVLLFMAIMYKMSGVAADIALLAYTVLVLLILSTLRITLTLPGIAGIILSIGMAVDANVVIFERIREEINSGRTLRSAIEAGYKRAFPAIVDSNVTTLIAGVVLFWLGTGPVKGFAQTLSIGILVSMFSALVITRHLMTSLVAIGLNKPSWYAKIENKITASQIVNAEEAPGKKIIPFIENRKKFFIFSGAVIALGILFVVINGARGQGVFNLDVEFSGGTSFTVDIGQPFENDDIAAIIGEVTGQTAPQVQKVTNSNQVMIKIRSIDAETRMALMDKIVEKYGIGRDAFTYSDVSATVSADMQRAAVLAMLVSMLCMLVYVTWRFKDIRMGASAIFALMHDALVVVSAYAIFRIPLNYSFIAVVLTIIGYSINATIIIFDRIRENRVTLRREPAANLVNVSVTQTLRRSIYTSVTTLLAILCLYFMGVPSIKEFTLPLIIGLLFGAYSSVCLAGSFWFTLGKKKKAA
ncbi:MAG: protein translocase subunit SecD [Clostridiales bacterium]|jgi:SecD/SecF fusion protein|nr:protein translocase subunit SecD [Clostridiales bacterium]